MTRLPPVARTPPPSATGYFALQASFCCTGSHATSFPIGGGREANLALSGPSYRSSPPILLAPGLYFHFASGACSFCVPSFAGKYTRPVAGLNAIGYQLCAPSGSGETITGLNPADAVGASMGRPVLGS